jgi:methylmalonyl-CoA/ethylmalonyl-CoA epimerase
MIGRLNHVAIATNDIKRAAKVYREVLGAKVSDEAPQPDHGVTTVFVDLGNTKIELLEPLGENSPIANFLKKNPNGGVHHVCYEVDDIYAARDRMRAEGATITGTGKPVIFLHPKDFVGTLIELEQA